MSTRNSIAWDQKYHIYSEMFEEHEGIYVEFSTDLPLFELHPGQITVKIPKEVVEAILESSKEIKDRLNSPSPLDKLV